MLCQMAQTGQLGGKMTESDLKNLLERFITSQQTSLSDHFSRGSDLKNLLERFVTSQQSSLSDHFIQESELKNLRKMLSFHNDPLLLIILFNLRMSAGQAANKVKFDRRRAMDSDDDDDLEGL